MGALQQKIKVPPRLLVLALVAVGWAFVGDNYWIFTVTSGVVLGIAGLGLMTVVGWGREISLVQAGLTGTAAYITGFAYRSTEGGWGLPFLGAVAVAVLAVVALSLLVSLATAKLSGLYIMVLTLGLQFLIERTVFTSRKLTGGITAIQTPRPSLFGVDLNSDRAYYLFCLAVVGLLVFLLVRFRRSRYGRALMLVGVDRKAAAASGISPWRYKIFAFALAGLFAGVAGALTAPLFRSPPLPLTFSAFYSLQYLAVPVVAGFESLVAVVGIAVLFAVVPQVFESWHISPFVLGGVGLLAGTLAGPRGVSGAVSDIWLWVKDKAGRGDRELVLDRDGAADPERRRRALAVLEAYMPKRDESGAALVARDISLAFGGLQALHKVDITVPTHQFVGLLGPNGAGKSTLFDVVNGLRKPDSGEITMFGEDVTRMEAWDRASRGMSRTFQANRINADLPVGENLLIGATKMIRASLAGSVLGLPKARAEEARAEEAARAVAVLLDIEHHWDERAGELDFGSQRRVEIGRSLLSGPRLLLLDEPAAGLDAHETESLFDLIGKLKDDLGLTVLLVEHYVKAVLDNSDLVYVLNQGKLLACGTPEEVAANHEVQAEYLGSASFLPVHTEEPIDA
ncbi:MAG: ATP-binding cassette domain-containing protein [Actinomycetota bacterium]|jgi:ABC-type branched-subunit amino acid transport system ATPase component/ABC-type branched-subunit amino acid transport system permease subunit